MFHDDECDKTMYEGAACTCSLAFGSADSEGPYVPDEDRPGHELDY